MANLSAKHLLYPLQCPVMDYAWGQSGKESYIRQVFESSQVCLQNDAASAGKPAAELWMGAHPRASAQIHTENGSLYLDKELAAEPSRYLGPQFAKKGRQNLPFLFKVLDVKHPLSLQAIRIVSWPKNCIQKIPNTIRTLSTSQNLQFA